jgi:hypothetical protein
MTTRYTVYDQITMQVFGRGLTRDEVHQCAADNVLVRDRETEAEMRRDDPGSDTMWLKTRPLGVVSDDGFEDIIAARTIAARTA